LIASSLLRRQPAWVGDLTYIATEEGWLFLAVVIDLFSRKVVGWSMRPDMQRDLVTTLWRWPGSNASRQGDRVDLS